jgi:uncharacterized protein involved in cysteine biosynthesis
MLTAFLLALGQIGDPRVLRVLAKSLAATVLLYAILATIGWWGFDRLLSSFGLLEAKLGHVTGMRGLIALVVVLMGGWLLWRVLALAVLQFFADEVVEAVEARHYPDALARARPLGIHEEVRQGLDGAARALLFNLVALPFALFLLVTGIGTALVFFLVNAVLLGRELTDMVWLRHRHLPDAPPPVGRAHRIALGGAVAAVLTIPFVNLLAPVLGAAMATHLVHRKGANGHAA